MIWNVLFGEETDMKVTCFVLAPFVLAGGFHQPYLLWRVGACVMAILLVTVAIWDKAVSLAKRIRDSIAERSRRRLEKEWESNYNGSPED